MNDRQTQWRWQKKSFFLLLLIFTMTAIYPPVFCQVFTFEDFQAEYQAVEEEVKTEEQIAVEDAKRDVNSHLDKYKWFTTGVLLPIISLSLSQRDPEKIPVARLIGKSQIYIAFYTEQYRIELKKKRYLWTLRGCALSSLIMGGVTYAVFYFQK